MSTTPAAPPRGQTPPPPPPKGPTTKAAAPDAPVGGIPAYGTLIQVLSSGTGATEAYTNIEGAGDITGPTNAMAEVDVTSHSTGIPIKQTVPGLIDLGDISFPCFWIPGDPTQAPDSPYGLEFLFFNRIVTKWQLVAPDPTHYTRQFHGFIKGLAEDYKVTGVMTRTVQIRITTPLLQVASSISLSPASNPNVPATGSPTGTIQVKAGGSNAPWMAVPSDSTWITITTPTSQQQGDGTITYAVAANTTGSNRSGSIYVTGLGLTYSIDQLGT
jgi:hypothetical protein